MNCAFLGLLSLVLLTGCASPAAKLDGSLLAQIRDGSSTKESITALLGPPRVETVGSNGKRVALYHYRTGYANPDAQGAVTLDPDRPGSTTVHTRASGQVRLRTLSVLFGPDGRVERHHLYESTTAIAATAAGSQVGVPVRSAQLAHIFKGVTDRSDLAKHFGEPVGEVLDPEGNLVLTWFYSEGTGIIGAQPRRQLLEVVLDPQGIVGDYVVVQNAGIGTR